jgi:hypothetical protein
MENIDSIETEIKCDLKSVSKIKIERWRNNALKDKTYFEAAVRIGLTNQKPFCWRCSWIISKVTEKNPTLIEPFVDQIIRSLDNFKFDSQIGGFLKTLTYAKNIDEDYFGILTDYCIKIIYDAQRPSHNKYYAIQLLLRIANRYPELSREFALVIETNLPYFVKPYLKRYSKEAIRKLS